MRLRTTGERIPNTRRVERTLNLIAYLNGEFRTIREIGRHLDIHPKSVNRYLNLLVQLGFEVEWSHIRGGYHIFRIRNVGERLAARYKQEYDKSTRARM
jgi:DNA-binding IclR family transcriptional regulator